MDFFRNGAIGGAFLGVKVAPVATLLSFDVFALIALRNASLRSKSMSLAATAEIRFVSADDRRLRSGIHSALTNAL